MAVVLNHNVIISISLRRPSKLFYNHEALHPMHCMGYLVALCSSVLRLRIMLRFCTPSQCEQMKDAERSVVFVAAPVNYSRRSRIASFHL